MHPQAALLKFLADVDADLAGGGLRPVEHYVRRHPEHAEHIRAEFRRLFDNDDPAPSARRIAGRYEVLESLGRGGFGEVFLAEDRRLDRRVAIKVLSGARALSREWRARLLREAQATSRIAEDGLCPIHDAGEHEGAPFLVMPWIPGRSLDRLIAASAARGEAPVRIGPPGDLRQRRDGFLELVERLAHTLDTAHRAGVVHRDVKPANVLVRPDGRPVLIDFGLAWLEAGDPSLSRSGALGTQAYCAPEALHGDRPARDPRVDVFGLGVVLFEGLSLRRPFGPRPGISLERSLLEDPVPRLDPALGRDLQAVVETALARRPDRRYPSMAAFADDLARVRRGEPVRVRAAGPWRRLWARARSRPRLAGAAVAATALLAAGTLVGVSAWTRARERAVVARAITTLAENMRHLAKDAERLARFGFPLADRLAATERLLAAARSLREEAGASVEIDRGLARLLVAAAALDLQLGRVEKGAARGDEALVLLEDLARRKTASDGDRAGLAHALVLAGDARDHVGDLAGAFARFTRAQAIDRALLEARPDDPTRRSNVGFGHLRLGIVLDRLGRTEEAVEHVRSAVAELKRVERLDARVERLGHTAEAMLVLAGLLRRAGRRTAECRPLLDAADARIEEWARTFPRSAKAWRWRQDLNSERLALAAGPQERLRLAERMVADAQRLARLESGASYALAALGNAELGRAAALEELGRAAEAVQVVTDAIDGCARAFAAAPRIWMLQEFYFGALACGAALAERNGRGEEAAAWRRRAAALAERCWRDGPKSLSNLERLVQRLLCDELDGARKPGRVLELLAAWRAREGALPRSLRSLEARAHALLRSNAPELTAPRSPTPETPRSTPTPRAGSR